jgi:multidrug efflux pump subunit AcrA (membrane-fusion protein)
MEVVSRQRTENARGKYARCSRVLSRGSAVSRAVVLLFVVIVVAFIVIWGISSRKQANAQLAQETQDLAIPTVSVIHPKPGAPQQEIVLPGDMQPFADAPIFARTSGYLKSWSVDIGAKVKAGQALAEIDSPEVDQQLQQARADLATAEANLRRGSHRDPISGFAENGFCLAAGR